jgi:uncharacterized protein YukE
MKSILLILFSVLLLSTSLNAQSITILQNGQNFECGKHDTCFVLDATTFGKYHYTTHRYSELKKEIVQLDSLLTSQDSITQNLEREYNFLQMTYQTEIKDYKQTVTELSNHLTLCASVNEQLKVSYQKVETKTKRVKKWRNIFMGSTLFLTTLLIILK